MRVTRIPPACAAVAAVLALAGPGCAAGGADVAVYPTAGTPDASATTQISFRGVAASALSGISVVGSRTGAHTGRLAAHSDGKGASFLPAKPFAPGETVTVKADESLVGATDGAVRFRIARKPPPLGPGLAFPDGSNPKAPGTNTYRTRPDLRPPGVKVTVAAPQASDGYVFLAPKSGPGQDGPLILDRHGRVVWFHPVKPGFKSYDFRVQQYDGKPVLTWWQGDAAGAYGGGTGVIVDDHYQVIATVRGANGYLPDIHEFRLTPQGTALVLAYEAVGWDMRPYKGPANGIVVDSIVQEIDVKTGLVLFEWHALGHVGLQESFAAYGGKGPYDYAHLNSIEVEPDGNLLVSARNTDTAYEVDRASGNILWRIGGKQSSYQLPADASFVAQHDVERDPDGTISLFDDGSFAPPLKRAARALVLSLDGTPKIVHAFSQPQGHGTVSQGSVQLLPNGHYLVGWGGGIPDVSEFAPDGTLLFDAHLLSKVESYRAYRFPWKGSPQRPPDVAAQTRSGRTLVWASWNGATEVASWQVLAGADASSLTPQTVVSRAGFETQIVLPSAVGAVAVRALDADGAPLGTSKTIRPTG